MCANCISTLDAIVFGGGLTIFALHNPTRDVLVELGVVPVPDPMERDVRTVSFLRRLDLDPGEVLGEETVAAVDAWEPSPRVYRDTALRRFIERRGAPAPTRRPVFA